MTDPTVMMAGQSRRCERRDRAALARTLGIIALLAALPVHAQDAEAPPAAPGIVVANPIVFGARGALQGVDAAVRVGATYTDNINRSETNREVETIPEVGARVTVAEAHPHIQTNIESDLEYQDYVRRTYPNDVIGGFNGAVLYSPIPDRLGWLVQDNFGETRANALTAETPANRQNVNLFTTGPDIAIPLGAQTKLTMDARWSKSTFATTLANDEQEQATVGLVRKLSPATSLALDVEGQKVTYDETTVDNNFTVDSAYVELVTGGHRTVLTLDLGATVLHDFAGAKTQPLAHLTFSHLMTPRTKLTLDVGASFSDAAQVFRDTQTSTGVTLGSNDVVAGSDPMRARYGAATWSYTSPRTTLQLGVNAESQRHERNLQLDRDRTGAIVVFTRELTSALSLGLAGSYGRQNFTTLALIIDDWVADGTLTWRMSRSFWLTARAGRRAGAGPVQTTYTYTERHASLFFQYGWKH